MSASGSSIRLQGSEMPPQPKQAVRGKLALVNTILVCVLLFAILVLIIIWIWEEVATDGMYFVESFIDNPKFRQARAVLMTSHGAAFFLLSVLQFCLQAEDTGKESPTRARRVLWSLATSVLCLIYMTAGILAVVYKSDDIEVLHSKMASMMSKPFYIEESITEEGEAFNLLQSYYGCCGVDSGSDYSDYENNHSTPFPVSCCKLKSGTSSDVQIEDAEDWSRCSAKEPEFYNSDGCYTELNTDVINTCTEVYIISFTLSASVLFVGLFKLIVDGYFEKQLEKYIKSLISKNLELQVRNGGSTELKNRQVSPVTIETDDQVSRVSSIGNGTKNEIAAPSPVQC